MTSYTHKLDKNLDNWMFHEDYFTEETRFLPKSIQRELVGRLTNCKRPVSDIKSKNPKIESKLMDICASYRDKQQRSKINSHRHRLQAKKQASEPPSEQAETQSEQAETQSEQAKPQRGHLLKKPQLSRREQHREFYEFMDSLRI